MPIKALHKYYLCICYLFCIFIFSFYHSALLFLYADIIFNFPDSASDSYSVGLTIFALSWLLLQYYRYIWYLLIFLKKYWENTIVMYCKYPYSYFAVFAIFALSWLLLRYFFCNSVFHYWRSETPRVGLRPSGPRNVTIILPIWNIGLVAELCVYMWTHYSWLLLLTFSLALFCLLCRQHS